MKCRAFFAIFFCFATLTPAFGNNDSPLDKAEALITELKFYDALIALEPLLTADQKSEDQEEALWLANTLCNQLRKSLSDEFREIELDSLWRKFREDQRSGAALKWEKAAVLNRLGADIVYDEIGADYWYHYGFLKRLITLYPDSSWRPAAEYYLIQEDYPTPQDIDKTSMHCTTTLRSTRKVGLQRSTWLILILHISITVFGRCLPILIIPTADTLKLAVAIRKKTNNGPRDTKRKPSSITQSSLSGMEISSDMKARMPLNTLKN